MACYPPYGYRWDGRTLRIIPEQAAIVKRIFAEVLDGKGTDAIAKELDAEGVPTKRGGKWTTTSVRGILANEKYTGDVIFQKTYTDDSFNRHTNYGEMDMYYVPDHHEAIISKEDFEAAGLVVAQRAAEKGIERGNEKYQQRYAFSGKIICGECGDIVNTLKDTAWIKSLLALKLMEFLPERVKQDGTLAQSIKS